MPKFEESISSLISKGKSAHNERNAERMSQQQDKTDFDLIADVFNSIFARRIVSFFGGFGKDFYKTETKVVIYIILIIIPLCYLVSKITF